MSGSFAVSGLISGLDTDAIIESLVNVKQAQLVTPLQDRVVELTAQNSALDSVQAALDSFRSSALSLRSLSEFEGRTSNSTSSKIEIQTTSNSALKGSYTVYVEQLAQADRNYFTGVADKDLTQFGTGTITIGIASGESIDVVIDSDNNTLEGIRDAINSADGPVTASIVNDGGANPYRLILTTNETGADANITTNNIAAVLTGLADDAGLNADPLNQAQDSQVTINGLDIFDSDNTISDAIPGLTFNILETEPSAGSSPITVTVGDDFTSSIDRISQFMISFNETMAEFKSQFAVDTNTGASVGILSSDITLQSIQSRLNDQVLTIQNQLAGNAYQSLAQIGITMNEDGLMDVDTVKLGEKLSEDSDSVRRLFQGMNSDVDGIADNVYEYLRDVTNPADGILAKKEQIWQDQIRDLVSLISEREERITQFEERTRDKFLYMEQTLLNLQGQSSALESAQTQLDNLAKQKTNF